MASFKNSQNLNYSKLVTGSVYLQLNLIIQYMNWHLYGYSWRIPSLCLRLARGHPSGCWSGDTARTKHYLIVSCAECFLALSSSGVSDPVTRHQKPEWGGQPVPLRASGGLGIQVLRGPHAQMAGSCLSSRAGPRPDRWMLSGLSAVGWPGSLGLGQWGMPAVFLVHTLCLSSLPSCPYRTTRWPHCVSDSNSNKDSNLGLR